MPKTEEVTPPKRRMPLDRSDWMAILAVFISSGAFFVSLYEANIMREQQEIMQSQQKASVWPYLEPDGNTTMDSSKTSYTLSLSNKGVGPARIMNFTLFINDEIVRDYDMIGEKLRSLQTDNSQGIAHSYSPPSGVISANSTKNILEITQPRRNKFDISFVNISELEITYEICYCSIYGNCWTMSSQNLEPKEGCNTKL